MCYCGDTACGSCGPAQGFDPEEEAAHERDYAEWCAARDREDFAYMVEHQTDPREGR